MLKTNMFNYFICYLSASGMMEKNGTRIPMNIGTDATDLHGFIMVFNCLLFATFTNHI